MDRKIHHPAYRYVCRPEDERHIGNPIQPDNFIIRDESVSVWHGEQQRSFVQDVQQEMQRKGSYTHKSGSQSSNEQDLQQAEYLGENEDEIRESHQDKMFWKMVEEMKENIRRKKQKEEREKKDDGQKVVGQVQRTQLRSLLQYPELPILHEPSLEPVPVLQNRFLDQKPQNLQIHRREYLQTQEQVGLPIQRQEMTPAPFQNSRNEQFPSHNTEPFSFFEDNITPEK